MPSILSNLTEDEKNIYLSSLLYILNLNQNQNMDYILNCVNDLGRCESDLKKIKKVKKIENLIEMIKSIKDIKKKRYVLREMILVAISNHELSDEEMTSIYNIGTHIGIKEEKINDFFLWAAKGIEWEIEGIQLIEGDL